MFAGAPFMTVSSAVYALGALICAVLMLLPAEAVTGVHPALKPLKFSISVGVFLATMALIVPMLPISDWWRRAGDVLLSATMAAEMVVIYVQAVRGTTSHFNMGTLGDAFGWQVMAGAIVVMTLVMGWFAVAAWFGPLTWRGEPVGPALTVAVRLGLAVFMLSAVSGFMMGGQSSHTVGGPDGGPGLPFLNWSTQFGDLRVSHFLSLHGIQFLPLIAIGAAAAGLRSSGQLAVVVAVAAAYGGIAVATLVQAAMGRPVVG